MPVLFLTVVIDLIGFGIMMPILPFLAPQLGGNDFDIAMIILIYSLFAGICGPFWGKLSDRFGRKPIILCCLSGTAISYIMLAFSPTLWAVYISRAVCGMMAGNFGVASAMIADITTPENRARGMGLIGAAFGLGMVIGPFIGGVLAGDDMSYSRPAFAAAGLSLLAMIAGAITLKESRPKSERHRQDTDTPSISIYQMVKQAGNRLLLLQYFLHNSCVSFVAFLFPLMARDYLEWGPKEVGIVFGFQGVLMALLQSRAIGPMASRFGELGSLRIGVSVALTGLLLFTFFADNSASIVTAFFIAITGATFCMPMLNSITSQRTPAEHRGRMMGTTASMSSFGRVCAPAVAGATLSFSGFPTAWLIASFFAIAYLSWVISEIRKEKKALA